MNSTIDISAIRKGDEKAFVVMYYLLNGKVYNYCLRKQFFQLLHHHINLTLGVEFTEREPDGGTVVVFT